MAVELRIESGDVSHEEASAFAKMAIEEGQFTSILARLLGWGRGVSQVDCRGM